LDGEGRITIDGFAWDTSEARELVNEAAREPVELVDLETDPRRFDVLPLLVATDGAVDTLGIDSRRLRPNIIVGGVPGIAERAWPGHALRLGSIIIHAAQLRMRCVMTTFDPDTLQQDPRVLRHIVKEMEGKVALDCSVKTPGYVRENDAVEVLPLDNPQ
jgi:hypothetical protein